MAKDIEIARMDDVLVLRPCTPRLDHESADRLRQAVDDAELTGGDRILVDLTHVTHVDSFGLGALVASRRHRVAAVACPPGTAVRRMLHTVRLDRVLALADDVPGALFALGALPRAR